MSVSDGWYKDPFGVHEFRYYAAGSPTGHVCDGQSVSYDFPPPPVRSRACALQERQIASSIALQLPHSERAAESPPPSGITSVGSCGSASGPVQALGDCREWTRFADQGIAPASTRTHMARRKVVIVCCLFIVVVGSVVGLVVSLGGQSRSYKDGYVAGHADGYGNRGRLDARITCTTLGIFDIPSGDNRDEWSRGCLDGYNAGLLEGGRSVPSQPGAPSYKDGYVSGQAEEHGDRGGVDASLESPGEHPLGADDSCALSASYQIQPGDNPDKWFQGCLDGYKAAQRMTGYGKNRTIR